MDKVTVVNLLTALGAGKVKVEDVYAELQDLPYKNIDFARLDTHRAMRQGMPEVIFCPGKTPEQVMTIARTLKEAHEIIVGTKASPELAAIVQIEMPETQYFPQGKILLWGKMPEVKKQDFTVSIITAGTADMPIAEEATLYLQAAGVAVHRLNDVGIAGLHRLLGELPSLKDIAVSIVVAGMDGALPGVVAGLLSKPVIAVPTSVGYGGSFGGIAPLLTMLNSCAAGLTVVNIDNGFGAAVAALRIMYLTC